VRRRQAEAVAVEVETKICIPESYVVLEKVLGFQIESKIACSFLIVSIVIARLKKISSVSALGMS